MRPLIELLGARWKLGASVVAVAWSEAGGTAGIALADGTLAIVHDRWDGGPKLRTRPDGGVEVVPARQSPPPAMRAGLHTGPMTCLAADPAGGFVTGGADGQLMRCDVQGVATPLDAPAASGPIACIDAAATRRAAAVGNRVLLSHGNFWASADLPAEVSALAFDPSGRTLAVAHAGGITLLDDVATSRRFAVEGAPSALCWRADGAVLAAGLPDALRAWHVADGALIMSEACPAPPSAVRFGAGGGFLATANTDAILCWAFDPAAKRTGPIICGVASRIPASAVACHLHRPVIAAGYRNGALMLCQPHSEDVLFARQADGDAITALAWQPDGDALLYGTQAGEIGVLALPATIFRADAGRPSGEAAMREAVA